MVDVSNFTLLIKTIMRPVKLARLLQSAREAYPDLEIVVADDGPEGQRADAICRHLEVTYATFPEDVGIGTCYNSVLGSISTPYTIICDDDNRFVEGTTIETWEPFLRHGIYDLIGGSVRRTRGGNLQSYVGNFEWGQHYHDGYEVHMRQIATRDLERPISAQFVMNWFAARTDFLRANSWDPVLKVCRHEDYFLGCHWTAPGPDHPKPAPKIGYHPRVEITHDRDVEPFDSRAYLALRSGRFQDHLRMVEKKWGLRKNGLRTP
jgi:glycosyltransferase involved in cell wall biosynthesis